MSSMASGCNHIDHVTTQLPYAMTVASIALLIGTIPTGYGIPPTIMIPVGIALVYLIIILFGRKVD
jgi:Na+/H+ antiporter NhaC